jgi:hypothetical protein
MNEVAKIVAVTVTAILVGRVAENASYMLIMKSLKKK